MRWAWARHGDRFWRGVHEGGSAALIERVEPSGGGGVWYMATLAGQTVPTWHRTLREAQEALEGKPPMPAFKEGQHAYRLGIGRAANPYARQGTRWLASEWTRGWNLAARERAEREGRPRSWVGGRGRWGGRGGLSSYWEV